MAEKGWSTIISRLAEPLKFVWLANLTYISLKHFCEVLLAISTRDQCKACAGRTTKAIFFPDDKATCQKLLLQGSCDESSCRYDHGNTALSYLTKQLSAAKKSIDICVFIITSQDLADVILKKNDEGVIVRVVTDCEKMDLNYSQIEQFRASGIQVRHDKTSYLMHHKFAIVDSQLLINGSFNWTRQAIMGNRENLLICDIPAIVKPYIDEFEKLWMIYKAV